ncbi:MAG: HD domain-containing protein [Deltaproteobacteria bacterium]|nr:HD domain-containing protein [Deltaproteobacteria bacterium]MCL5276513.1 HD domain-containing protein [Deltaproteobacteria bacterium]
MKKKCKDSTTYLMTGKMNNSTLNQLLATLSLIIDYQGGEQLYHAWRVAIVAKYVCDEISPAESQWLFYAGLLHDVGITGIESHPARYPELEESHLSYWLRYHPVIGANIVEKIPGLSRVAPWIRDHHEWINGKGFPAHKREQSIHVNSQILRVADDYDLRFRTRAGLTRSDMYEYFRSHVGTEFSPHMWDVLRRLNSKDMGLFFFEVNDESRLPYKLKEIMHDLPAIDGTVSEDVSIDVILRVFGIVIDARHHYTAGHSERVREYSMILSKRLGIKGHELKSIARAAYLHDLGKIATPLSILNKAGPLNKSEWKTMRRHTIYTMELIDAVEALWELGPLAGYSQERYDGTGYPDGLKGSAIPMGARIIAVADAIDAIKTRRSYKRALSWRVVVRELKKSSGSMYDPEIIDHAIDYITEEKLAL